MLNSGVQVSVNQTGYLQLLKNEKDRHQCGYFASYYQNNKAKYQKKQLDKRTGDRHKLNRKTRYRFEVLTKEGYQATSLGKILGENLVLSGGQNHPYIALNISKRTCFFYTPLLTRDEKNVAGGGGE
jgi:hypothetical protein